MENIKNIKVYSVDENEIMELEEYADYGKGLFIKCDPEYPKAIMFGVDFPVKYIISTAIKDHRC